MYLSQIFVILFCETEDRSENKQMDHGAMDYLYSWCMLGLITGLQFNDFREIPAILLSERELMFY